MNISFVLDRWEETYGVCFPENSVPFLLLRSAFPPQSKEQDWFLLCDDGSLVIDEEKTKQRRQENLDLYKSLLKKK